MHAIAWPTYDRSWDPEIAVKTRILDKRWQGILVIPWALLELDFKDIQSLRMNVGQAYRVAPKHWFSWHYWGYKFDPKTTLADILLQKKTP